MTNQPDNIADSESTALPSPQTSASRGAMLLSIIGLIAGVVALGLAAIPAIAFERALPNPFADTKKNERDAEPPAEREGGVTFKFKSLSVTLGGKAPKKEQPAEAPPEVTKDPIRWFTMAAIGCALIGLAVASIGHLRERHTVLTVSSMGCCAAAITWQYFAIGVAIGAAVAAFLVVLAILGSVLR
jgi:hypothetical protein